MPAVLIELEDGTGLRTPEALDADRERVPGDLWYFVVAARVAAALTPGVERFVLSYTQRVGETLGPTDVWFLIGDEKATRLARPPRCPVFRTYGDRFGVPWRGLHGDPRLAVAEVALWCRNRSRGLRRAWPRVLPATGGRCAGWLPLGVPGWKVPPDSVAPIESRRFDVSFRGSLRGERSFAPKTLSRRRMAAALDRVGPRVAVDFVETSSFVASYGRDPSSYAESLLQTKICLAPRGGSVETFRTFEGALAGCVLITEPLPPAWFYAGLPRVELRSWRALPRTVADLLADPPLMQQMSRAARDWALNVVSPEAIGRWVARRLSEN